MAGAPRRTGQFRGAHGAVRREGRILLIVLYPQAARERSACVDDIRAAYARTFAQESVLRADATVRVHGAGAPSDTER